MELFASQGSTCNIPVKADVSVSMSTKISGVIRSSGVQEERSSLVQAFHARKMKKSYMLFHVIEV